MGIRYEILQALFDPMNQVKISTIQGLNRLFADKASQLEPWWAWTAWLACGLAVEKIQNA